jgi:hypothetical protein
LRGPDHRHKRRAGGTGVFDEALFCYIVRLITIPHRQPVPISVSFRDVGPVIFPSSQGLRQSAKEQRRPPYGAMPVPLGLVPQGRLQWFPDY